MLGPEEDAVLQIEKLILRLYGRALPIERFETLKGDASSRRYHRVILGPGAEPPRLVVMELPEDALRSDEAVSGKPPTELPFLNVCRHLAAAGLPVPRVHLDAAAEGAVLLEDLGDETFAKRIAAVGAGGMEVWYGAAVDLLARVHDRMWPIPATCEASSRAFDFALLRWELDHYREWGLEAVHGALDPGRRARLDAAFDALAREIGALPRGFVHRDYQSRNLMIRGDAPEPGSLVVIDFQDALEGPRIYDVVALLNDSYVDVPFEVQRRIIARYAERRGLDEGALAREFDLVTVQRKLKDGGRFVFIDRVKGNPSFLPFVDASFGRVRAALARLPGHEELKSALAEADPKRFG